MILYRLPVRAYFDALQGNQSMEYIICCSDYIFNNYQKYTYDNYFFYTTGENVELDPTSIAGLFRDAVGDDIIVRNMPVYLNNKGIEGQSISDYAKTIINTMGLTPTYITFPASLTYWPTRLVNVNDGKEIVCRGSAGRTISMVGNCLQSYFAEVQNISSFVGGHDVDSVGFNDPQISFSANARFGRFKFVVFPEGIFSGGTINTDALVAAGYRAIVVEYSIAFNASFDKVTRAHLAIHKDKNMDSLSLIQTYFAAVTSADGPATQVTDGDNPYGSTGVSMTGGGNGHYGDIDDVDGADIPGLPSITAADLGFITMYNPTRAQLLALSNFMWSGLFDLDTYKKLFSDPMESIIGLSIVPVAPTIGGSKNVMFGSIDSGVSMSYLSTQYVQFSCGSVTIEDYIGSFLDYSPYTKISIYLPYIGIHELSPDDIMNSTITVTYNIDVLSGACGAFISSSSKGVLYSYNGSCISNIPLTSINFSSAIQNAVSAVCSGAAIVAGVASGNAPITAMGATSMLGSAANTALNSKPSVQRSGSLGGSAGVLSVQKPYLIIERPNLSVPANVQKFVGQTSNITSYLGSLKGFTMIEYVHIEGVPATDEEIKEIEALLKEGVYL